MAEISINTTQNVNINFKIADVGVRMGAYAVDLVMKFCYVLFINWAIINRLDLSELTWDNWSVMSVYIIFYLPVMFYSIIQESLMEGQSIGKKLFSLKVVKIDGYQASFTDYLIRWVFRLVDVTGTFYLAGGISILVSKIHQRIGDIAAGTAVINLKNNINISHTILEEIAQDYVPLYPNVVRFSDNDMRIIKETYLNARKNNDYITLQKLVNKIEEVSGIKREGNDISFISRVIRDYNYFTGEG